MTQPASEADRPRMRDGRLVQTEELLAKPKRFVRELLSMPDGFEIDWYYVDTPASVLVVPVTADGKVVMVKQYRHNLKTDTLEMPAGAVDADEPPEHAAVREMEEETGYALAEAAQLVPLGRFYSLPSETNKYTYCFLARPVVKAGPARGDDLIEKYFDMSVVEMPLGDVFASIGSAIDGMETVGALMLARQHLDG